MSKKLLFKVILVCGVLGLVSGLLVSRMDLPFWVIPLVAVFTGVYGAFLVVKFWND